MAIEEAKATILVVLPSSQGKKLFSEDTRPVNNVDLNA